MFDGADGLTTANGTGTSINRFGRSTFQWPSGFPREFVSIASIASRSARVLSRFLSVRQ